MLCAVIAVATCGQHLIYSAARRSVAALALAFDAILALDLVSLLNHLECAQIASPPVPKYLFAARSYPDMKDLEGQYTVGWFLEIDTAGGHNLLRDGQNGVGKLCHGRPGLYRDTAHATRRVCKCAITARPTVQNC